MFSKNKGVLLEIFLNDDFNGTMYGLPEESLGCKLSGKVVLNNRNPLPARYLLFEFIGKIIVACEPPMSFTRPEYSESKIIIQKECLFHDSTTTHKSIPAGTHEYYFEFELPGYLPSSFKGARGKIEYYCSATLARPIFRNDIIVRKTVHLKRCLMDETRATQTHHTTYTEGLLDDKIRYQISTPIMTYREGGLVHNELTIKSMDSDIVIEAVEYGLKELVHYHTTGEEAMTVIANVNEERYPLGKRRIKVDQHIYDGNSITINFRLCPWVNCDVNSQLINIFHKLSFTICVSETAIDNGSVFSEGANRRSSRRFSTRTLRRSSRALSLSNIVNSPRSTLISKGEKKRLQFEIPLIVTAKSCRPRQQSPPYAFVDRPPDYAIASMVPPPPEYIDINISELTLHENLSDDYVAYDS